MQKLILFSLVIVHTFSSNCQPSTEFAIHDNGLIYDEFTMNKLGHIVDSLNLRFKSCEPKNYTALPQGYATFTHVPGNGKKVREAIRNNISVEDFVKTFGASHQKAWIIKSVYKDYRGRKTIEYFSLPLRERSAIGLTLPFRSGNDKIRGWVMEEDEDGISALFLEGLKEPELVPAYARLVQYVDCMIDTTAQIYLTEKSSRSYPEPPPDSKITRFLAWANDYEGEPQLPKIEWDGPFAESQYAKFQREHTQWNNARIAALDEKIQKGHYYKSLLMEATAEAIDNSIGNGELEFYVERYLSAKQALQMKRNRQPQGNCSMDQTPRIHAANICRLAASTAQWDIFLRAHLDIMNDNFSRASDGSWAWAGRGTYLKELEELDINAPDLLIGTCLRAGNVSDNHYFGDIGRIGRALSETSKNNELENRLLLMIADEQLDLFNRLLIVYLFDNYNHHLKDEERKASNVARFKTALATLPDGIGETVVK
jgi:hypothetical protein